MELRIWLITLKCISLGTREWSLPSALQSVRCEFEGVAPSQVAEEWALTRAEAARAKAAGDKARQKTAGQLIAGLKREIQQLGGTHLVRLHMRSGMRITGHSN